MFLPRYSLRFLFLICAVIALLSAIASAATTGSSWAIGLIGTVLIIVVMLIIHAALFGVIYLFGRIMPDHRTQLPTFVPGVDGVPNVESQTSIPAFEPRKAMELGE